MGQARITICESLKPAASALTVFGTRHSADNGVDVSALAFDFVGVETPPRDAIVADAHDDDTTLLERRAVDLGSRPVDLHEDGVSINRRPEDLCVKVGDAFEERRPVGAHL